MIRAAKLVALAVGSLVVIGVGSFLLFWLGRSMPRGELVEEAIGYDDDDVGHDVDEESWS